MKKARYIVTELNMEHKHDFVVSYHCHLIPSNRNEPVQVTKNAIALRRVGIKTSLMGGF